jgi:uncharacterized membrane protein
MLTVPNIVAFTLCVLLFVVALPLALRLVRPNAWYGFRTPETLANPELWYSVNAFSGRCLLISTLASAALLWFRPAWFDFGVFTQVAALALPAIGAVFASFMYLSRHR